MGKGKRVKTKRKKQKINDTLQVIPLQNYPENTPTYLRHMATESGEILMEDQEWVTLPKQNFDLHLDLVTSQGIVTTVNGKFQVFAIPVCVEQLSYDKKRYDKCPLVKGARKDFAVNKTATFHVGTPKFYHDLESADNSSQKDPHEGRILMGKNAILQFQDPESKNWIPLPHEGITINYGHGYIYCCSIVEGDEIKPPHEYGTYTTFNASPQRIALALGIDVGNHLIEKGCKITGVPEIRVFYGKVEYLDHEEQSLLYQRGAALPSRKFREDLVALFTKTPQYSHQKEFRFFITLDNVQWDFASHPSLQVPLSPYFQFHFGYTYWADEHEQNCNPK